METPESKVDAFLSSDKAVNRRAGHQCQTCIHPKRELIDAMLHRFDEKRSKSETTLSWSAFIRLCLIPDPDLSIAVRWKAIYRHAEDCLGIQSK